MKKLIVFRVMGKSLTRKAIREAAREFYRGPMIEVPCSVTVRLVSSGPDSRFLWPRLQVIEESLSEEICWNIGSLRMVSARGASDYCLVEIEREEPDDDC